MTLFKYRTYFKLTAPVNDFESAYKYLREDNMTTYLLDDDRCKSCKDDIHYIRWTLVDDESGYIDLETFRELSEEELDKISDWVSGQNSDGLGEGFEQQDFAYYLDEEFVDEDDSYEDDESNYIMSSFDWRTNKYKFELISK